MPGPSPPTGMCVDTAKSPDVRAGCAAGRPRRADRCLVRSSCARPAPCRPRRTHLMALQCSCSSPHPRSAPTCVLRLSRFMSHGTGPRAQLGGLVGGRAACASCLHAKHAAAAKPTGPHHQPHALRARAAPGFAWSFDRHCVTVSGLPPSLRSLAHVRQSQAGPTLAVTGTRATLQGDYDRLMAQAQRPRFHAVPELASETPSKMSPPDSSKATFALQNRANRHTIFAERASGRNSGACSCSRRQARAVPTAAQTHIAQWPGSSPASSGHRRRLPSPPRGAGWVCLSCCLAC